MAITRAQQFRQMLIKGGIANPDGRRGFGGGADMGTVGDSKGNVGPGKGGYQGGGDGKGGKAGGEGDGPVDKSSNLQNVNHMIAMGLDVPQGPINLKPREIELQNFLDRRNKVNLFGLSKFFTGPLQKVSDFNASINRPFFKKVNRADANSQDEIAWIEGTNVWGKPGWIKGKADYIVFERNDYWLVVDREELYDHVVKKVKENGVQKGRGIYKVYQRADRDWETM